MSFDNPYSSPVSEGEEERVRYTDLDPQIEQTFRYQMNKVTALWATLFFVCCTAALGYFAGTNDRGLIINGLIHLEEFGATVFLVVLAFFSLLFTMVGVAGLVMSPRRLVIRADNCEIPSGFLARKTKTVTFADVVSVSDSEISGTRLFTLVYRDGKASISNRMFEAKSIFNDVRELLLARIERAKS